MALRPRHNESHESHERWVVSYADFITLMFAFFTVLYATSEQNTEKTKQFEKSIRQYLVKIGVVGETGGKENPTPEQDTPIESPLNSFRKLETNVKDRKRVEHLVLNKLTSAQLDKYVKDISGEQLGIRISVDSDELFMRGSVQMKKAALPVLDRLAQVLKNTQKKIIIEGHSNDKPQSESLNGSWELSSIQATRVARYMSQIHHMDTSRLAVMSYGAERPLPPTNRRIDFLILTEDLPF